MEFPIYWCLSFLEKRWWENAGSHESKVSIVGTIFNFDGAYLQNCTCNHCSEFSKINEKDTEKTHFGNYKIMTK